jgi:serine phosphatase RsbU (regulator of sigma subunit)
MARTQRHGHRMPFCPGDTVLLFTDGLIERRTEDIDAGRERLTQGLAILAEGDLHEAVESLVHQVRDETQDDDVAAVALRRDLSPEPTGRSDGPVR